MRASLQIARRWRRSERPEGSAGFTLLEVMIAMAILSVALVALAGINSGAMNMHAYSKRLTVATFLARSKMADIEQKLQSEGLPADDQADDGTFEEEGYPQYRWQVQIIRPKTEEISANNLLSMAGLGSTDGSGSNASNPLAALGPLADKFIGDKSSGDITSALSGQGTAASGSAAAGAGGLLGTAMQSQLQMMIDNLGKTMREVRLTVSWGEEKNGTLDQFTVTTHVVSLGKGTDQMQSDLQAQAAAANAASATSGGGSALGTGSGTGMPVLPNGLNRAPLDAFSKLNGGKGFSPIDLFGKGKK